MRYCRAELRIRPCRTTSGNAAPSTVVSSVNETNNSMVVVPGRLMALTTAFMTFSSGR